MYTNTTINVSWNTQALYTALLKLLLVFLIATTAVASCDNNNDYINHDRTASRAERTLR